MSNEDHNLLIRIDERVESLYKEVCGNGQPGLKQRVASLELWRSMLAGALALFMIAVTVWGAIQQSEITQPDRTKIETSKK